MSKGAAPKAKKARKRPASRGPRVRGPGAGGLVHKHPFPKGQNHLGAPDDPPFRRGVDIIPRGSVSLMHKLLLEDDGTLAATLEREARLKDSPARAFRVRYLRSMLKGADKPGSALRIGAEIADRLEGRPVQKVETHRARTVIFYDASKPPPPELVGQGQTAASAAAEAPDEPTIVPATRLRDEVRTIAQAGMEAEP